jgi:predicted amino acid dehydrogenase
MATTWRLDARWQWVAGTQLVAQSAQSTDRDAQQACNFVIGVVGPVAVRVAFGHARHSAVLFSVMVGAMKTKTSRNDHTKSHRGLLLFTQLDLCVSAQQAGAECSLLQVEDC